MKRGTVLVAMALLGLPGLASAPAQDAGPKGQETQDRLRDSYRRLLARFRNELQSPDARPWDVAARAEALGNDPARILEYVRTRIRFEPYPGMQRGPAGVLASGGGNSPDKAYLLAELLRARGQKARIVRAPLDRRQAGELMVAALAAAKEGPVLKTSGPFGAGELDEKRLASLCAETGLSTEGYTRMRRAESLDRTSRWNEVLDVTEREFTFLRERFAGADAGKGRNLHDEIAEWLRAHYWVQWQRPGGEEWTDLDPTYPGLAMGRRVAEGEIVEPAAVADRFRLTLHLDRKVDGKRETVLLMEFDLPVHETLVRPVQFLILPDRGFEELLQTKEKMTEQQIRERLQSFRRFQAALKIGSEAVGSRPFDLDGKVFKVSANGILTGATTAEKVKGATDLFGDTPKPKTELSAVYVRFGVIREGKELWKRERAILEEGGQKSWCPILSWNLFFQDHPFPGTFERGLKMSQAVAHQGFAERAMEIAGSGKGPGEGLAAPGASYPFPLLSFARSRQSFANSRAAGRPWGLLWEHPDLFISGSQVRLGGAGGLCLCEGFDLVENGALVVEAGDRFSLRRDETGALGTFDTVLEQVLLRGANPSESTLGTLSSFERGRILGKEVRLLPASDAASLTGAGLSTSDATWVGRHARPEEQVLLVRGHGSAWWSHEPSTGRTVGRITGGRGGCEVRNSTVEYISIGANVMSAAFCLGVVIIKASRGPTTSLDEAIFYACVAGSFAGLGTVAFASSEFAASASFGILALSGLLSLIDEAINP